MLQRLRNRSKDEQGFTLIELLVVILIIGILAAIALPTFLGQREKAQDGSAKADARNMVSHMESCFTDEQSYAPCIVSGGASELTSANTGLTIGSAAGEVEVTSADATNYVIEAHSKSNGGTGRTFSITHSSTGNLRECTPDGGGCANGTW